ncbi:Electron transfer flavoprotein-ubiquinone oxidoreductase, mitochondrial [Vitis vinifera]|uniref:Electron transfer flavoprotein-ubiquinone oxidoreductase n=1 Tax=Vitis vinifera TaxID=29760 RepID=A0A438HVX3_VITVI|nr:Electron transfer flavoprotein-ubiquinone oxidoreductase, mitochondrial [Vitis vinifera]
MVSESLSQLVRWLGGKAEELGVEIYPGFAASEILYDANHNVIGIGTNDMGIAKDGSKKDNFQRGVELRVFMSIYHIWFLMLLLGRVTLLAEGCRGSLSEKVLRDYNLREKAQAQHQTYALGIKSYSLNSMEIDEAKHKTGTVLHTLGWPLDHRTYGGSFLYHMNDRQVVGTLSVIKIIHAAVSTQMNSGPGLITLVFIIHVHLSRRSSKYHYYATSEALPMTYAVHYKINDFGSSCGDMFLGCNTQVSIGLVVALNYHNPFLNPYEEFQKLKHHPAIKPLLKGGTVLQYGARTLNEGGFQSIPYPVFPGGAIIGCSAGFLNVPKIKGTHTAMKSGNNRRDLIG